MNMTASCSAAAGAFVDSSSSSSSIGLGNSQQDITQTTFLQVQGLYNGSWLSFLVIVIASSRLGSLFPKLGLPLITGYLAVGVLCGPYLLNLITLNQLPDLSPVTQIALSFISLSAGAELYLPELRALFTKILTVTLVNAFISFVACTTFIYLLASVGLVSWMNTFSSGCILSISMIGGAIMVARSPASAIAVVKELRSKGPVTSLMLGVTVAGDVIVLVLFSVAVSITLSQCSDQGFQGSAFLLTLLSLVAAVGCGYMLGFVLVFLLWLPYASLTILPLAFLIFVSTDWFAVWSATQLGIPIVLDALLITITGAYVASNGSNNRLRFLKLLGTVAPFILLPFFTKVGLELNLSVLPACMPFALLVFSMRALCVFIGSGTGARLSNMSLKEQLYLWTTMLSQAGVSLGLASEVAVQFLPWGRDFQTMIVAVVVLNQILGPIACKFGLRNIFKEAGKQIDNENGSEDNEANKIKKMAIIGCNTTSLLVAQRLLDIGCAVIIFDTNKVKLEAAQRLHVKTLPVQEVNEEDAGHEASTSSSRKKYAVVEPSDIETSSTNTCIAVDYLQTVHITVDSSQTIADAIIAELSLQSTCSAFILHSAFINLEDDRSNFSIANDCLNHLHPSLQTVVACFDHPAYAERAAVAGIVPVIAESLSSHIITCFLIPNNEELNFFNRSETKQLRSSKASVVASTVQTSDFVLKLALLEERERAEWIQEHPSPSIEVEPVHSISLSGLATALSTEVQMGQVVSQAMREDYLDRIISMHNADEERDHHRDFTDVADSFLSPSTLSARSP